VSLAVSVPAVLRGGDQTGRGLTPNRIAETGATRSAGKIDQYRACPASTISPCREV